MISQQFLTAYGDCRPRPKTRKVSKDIDIYLKKKRLDAQRKAYKEAGLDRKKCLEEVKAFVKKKKKKR